MWHTAREYPPRTMPAMKSRARTFLLCMLAGLLCRASTAVAGQVWYVKQDVAGGANTGENWSDAFIELQAALAVAQSGDEIWVAAGTYLPDFDPATGAHSGLRTASFRLTRPVFLYGGFAGVETDKSQRAPGRNVTILSGDIGQSGNNSDNCYHVLTANNVAGSSLIDGFAIRAGRADAATEPDCHGGGICAHGSALSLVHCSFSDNYAGQRGGAIYNSAGGPVLTLCIFRGNRATQEGGAVFNQQTTASVVNCLFKENTAEVFGGAIANFDTTVTMVNCTLKGNSATFFGGGVASKGSQIQIGNSILWSNKPDQIVSFEPNSEFVSHSCIQDGGEYGTNTDSDPLFVGDRLSPESPAVDAGGNSWVPPGLTTDLDGRQRVCDGDGVGWAIVDMGAYEFTDQQPTLRLTSPNGGETLAAGGRHVVTWQGTGLTGYGVLALMKGETVLEEIGTAPSGSDSLSWRISGCLAEAADYSLRLTWYLDTGEELTDTSDGPFSISSLAPSLRLTSPNGGETLTAGAQYQVAWEGTGLTGYGTLTLMRGATYVDSFGVPYESMGRMSWRPCVFLTEAADYKLELTWYFDSGQELTDASDAPFAITGSRPKPTLTLTSPNGGEVWQAGQNVTVTWTSQNATGQVYLNLYKGAKLVATAHSIPMSAGTYEWPLCDGLTEGNDYELRIRWNGCGGSSEDRSDAAFSVRNTEPPTVITLTSPNGGETIQAGTVYPVTWTSTGIPGTVSITLQRDGKFVQSIGRPDVGVGRYDWPVCSSIGDGTNYSIQLEANTNCGTYLRDSSDGSFSIVGSTQPALSVTRPVPGEILQTDTMVFVTWKTIPSESMVTVELYKGPDRYLQIGWTQMADGEVPWWVCPSLPEGDDYSIRLTTENCDREALTVASGQFSIVGTSRSTITVASPNGGEAIDPNQPLRVTWTSTNPQGRVSIELWRSGAFVSTLGDANMSSGSLICYYLCPSIPAGCGYTVRVAQQPECGESASDFSDQPFEIVGSKPPPMIRLLSLNQGETLEAGETYTVTWESSEPFYDLWFELVPLEMYSGASLSYVQDSPNSARVTLCPDIANGTDYVLRLTAYGCLGMVSDESDGLLTVVGSKPSPTVSITGPPAGTVVRAGDTITITWTGNGIEGTVQAALYQNGNQRLTFNSAPSSRGSLTEEICEFLPEGQYTIRLGVSGCSTSSRDPTEVPITVTGSTFLPEVNVSSPTTGDILQPGTTHTIRWNATNPRGWASLSLRKQGADPLDGGPYIGRAPMSAGQFIWKIDEFQQPASDYVIQLSESYCSGSVRITSEAFTISNTGPPLPSLTLLSPNGGEVFEAGSTQTIIWTSTNPTGYVDVQLFQEGYHCQNLGIVPMADGRFDWTICPTGDDLANYSIYISWGEYDGPSASDESDGAFQIVNHSPRMSVVTKPDLVGQTLQAGTVHRLTWEIANAQDDLRIELQKDYFPITLLGVVPKATGEFDWHVCPFLEDGDHYNLAFYGFDCGSGNYSVYWYSGRFSIIGQSPSPQISITSPFGGETWAKGSTQAVTWTTADPDVDGTVEVSLESVNEEVTTRIGYANLSDGRFKCVVPNSLVAGEDYRIKLSPRLCESLYSAPLPATYSLGRFTITGSAMPCFDPNLSIRSPRAGNELVAGTTNRIIWTSDLPLGDVDVYLRLDTLGSSAVRYLGTAPVSQGFLDWQINPCWIPDTPATYRIDLVGLGFSGTGTDGFTIQPGQKAPIDFDGDCDADADDIVALEACSSGPGVPAATGCESKDLDHDGDVDQEDFGLLQACLTGPDVPTDPGCLER